MIKMDMVYKILGAFVIAALFAFFSGFVSKQIYKISPLTQEAYPIEVADFSVNPLAGSGSGASGSSAKKEKVAEPILALLANADIARGQKLSKTCSTCHKFEQGGGNGVGPNLWNIVGRQKQSVAGFKYSGKLNTQGGDVWTYAELNKFLWKPKNYAPGTKMAYAGMKKPADRAAMIAWLRSLSGAPKALPSASAIAAEAPQE